MNVDEINDTNRSVVQRIRTIQKPLVEIPTWIGACLNLRSIDMRYCGIQNVPPELFRLKHLEEVELSHNCISEIPSNIAECTSLKRLSLEDNDLEVLPASLGTSPSIELVEASHNRIGRIEEGFFRSKTLRFLHIDGNQLERIPPQIGRLQTLVSLSVCDNQVCLPVEIGRCRALAQIDHGPFQAISPWHIFAAWDQHCEKMCASIGDALEEQFDEQKLLDVVLLFWRKEDLET